jgi:hypothetical protein
MSCLTPTSLNRNSSQDYSFTGDLLASTPEDIRENIYFLCKDAKRHLKSFMGLESLKKINEDLQENLKTLKNFNFSLDNALENSIEIIGRVCSGDITHDTAYNLLKEELKNLDGFEETQSNISDSEGTSRDRRRTITPAMQIGRRTITPSRTITPAMQIERRAITPSRIVALNGISFPLLSQTNLNGEFDNLDIQVKPQSLPNSPLARSLEECPPPSLNFSHSVTQLFTPISDDEAKEEISFIINIQHPCFDRKKSLNSLPKRHPTPEKK